MIYRETRISTHYNITWSLIVAIEYMTFNRRRWTSYFCQCITLKCEMIRWYFCDHLIDSFKKKTDVILYSDELMFIWCVHCSVLKKWCEWFICHFNSICVFKMYRTREHNCKYKYSHITYVYVKLKWAGNINKFIGCLPKYFVSRFHCN